MYFFLLKTGLCLLYLYRFCTLIILVLAFLLVHASGEFVVLHTPDSVEFTVNGEVEQSSLKEILSAALGYTGKQVRRL